MSTCKAALAGLLLASFLLVGAAVAMAANPLTPPVALRQPKDVSIHGETRIDDYFWLRDRSRPETDAYLRAEADYTALWFKPLAEFKETLYQEMLGRVQQADQGVPVRDGRYYYYSRTLEGAQYPVHLRRNAAGPGRAYDESAPEQVLLDMNAMARGKKYLALAGRVVSPDGRRLAYALDETGGHDNTIYAKDIASGRALPVRLEKTEGFVWADDNQTLFYVTQDKAKRSHRLWRHRIGAKGPDTMLYEEKDELFSLSIDSTQDHRYLVLSSVAKDTTELVKVAAGEVVSLLSDVSAGELSRAKAQLKSGLFMARESPLARAEQAAGQVLLFGRLLTSAEIAQEIDAVEATDISALSDVILKPRRSVAAVLGPRPSLKAAEVFQAALA